MRHGSERIPGKNHRHFYDEPLFYKITRTLLGVAGIDQVVIDTDCPIVLELAAKEFPEVLLVERPSRLGGGETPMNDVLLHVLSEVPSDIYLQTHCTNPLLKEESVQRAIEVAKERFPVYDSLFSVTRLQTRLWDSLARPLNHNANILLRTQDLPPVYEENSCLYIFDKATLEERHNRIGVRPYLLEISPLEAVDIDIEDDFLLAAALYKMRAEKEGNAT